MKRLNSYIRGKPQLLEKVSLEKSIKITTAIGKSFIGKSRKYFPPHQYQNFRKFLVLCKKCKKQKKKKKKKKITGKQHKYRQRCFPLNFAKFSTYFVEQIDLAAVFYFGRVFVFCRSVNKNLLKWFLLIITKEYTPTRSTNLRSRNYTTLRSEGRQMPNFYY